MARKNDYGRWIISAGEIGAYIVCPEAWRLKSIAGVRAQKSPTSTVGRELHQEWARKVEESYTFARLARMALTILTGAIVIFFLVRSR